MERDHRRDPLLAQLAQDVAVVPDLARIERALGRLDPRPLDREPVRVLAHVAQQREVLAVAVIVVAGDRRGVAVGDVSRLPLPLPPVAVAVVALDLVGRARSAPEETPREATLPLSPRGEGLGVRAQAAALAGLSTRGAGMYSHAIGVSPSMSSWSIPARSIDLRCSSRSFCGRPSSRIHAALRGSAWLTIAAASPGCWVATRRATSRIRLPMASIVSSPGSVPRLALCTSQSGRRTGTCQYGTPCR